MMNSEDRFSYTWNIKVFVRNKRRGYTVNGTDNAVAILYEKSLKLYTSDCVESFIADGKVYSLLERTKRRRDFRRNILRD